MNKITVLKSHIPSKEFWELFDYASKKEVTHSRTTEYSINQCVVNHSVEITDEEIENEADKVHKSNGLHGYYIDGYHDGFMAAYEFIKNQINQKR